MPYENVQQVCVPCAVKITVIDGPHNNLYGFCEMFVISASSAVGYRTDEDAQERYQHVISGHGFSPLDVDQRLFDDPNGEFK